MSSSEAEKLPRHISLAGLVGFALLVGGWLCVVKMSSPQMRMNVGLFCMMPGAVILAFIVSYRRPTVAVMMVLFALIVGASHAALSAQESARERSQAQRLAMLQQLAQVLRAFPLKLPDYPNPERPVRSGAEIFAAIATNGQLPYKFPGMIPVRVDDGMKSFCGAENDRLIWRALPIPGDYVLIDIGKDGHAGRFAPALEGYRPVPTDANRDEVDDGDDDASIFFAIRMK